MRGSLIFAWIGLASAAGFALFSISFKVEQLENELSELNKLILREQNAVHVLRAEWSYLNRPANIEALTHDLLPDLRRIDTSQIGGIEDLSDAPPPTQANAPGADASIKKASARSER
jgi:hypothetical protein